MKNQALVSQHITSTIVIHMRLCASIIRNMINAMAQLSSQVSPVVSEGPVEGNLKEHIAHGTKGGRTMFEMQNRSM